MKRRIFLFFCFAALSVFAQLGDSLLAIVGDEVITMSNVLAMTAGEERSLAQAYSGKELQERITQLRRTTLDGLINHELFYLEFKSLKAQLPTGYLQERINHIIMERAHGNVELFEEQLQKEGMTVSEFREKVAKNLAVELLMRDRLTRGNIVSEEDIKKYFYKNEERFARPSRYRLSIIQLRKNGTFVGKIQQTFDEIMQKLAQGTPFADLAREYSEGAGAEKGGDQGWMEGLAPELLSAVQKLQVGQTCPRLVELGSNYYIVQLTACEPGGVPPLDDAIRNRIRQILSKEEENRRYRDYIKTLYMKYPVKRLDGG